MFVKYQAATVAAILFVLFPTQGLALTKIDEFRARPPIHVFKSAAAVPQGITPDQIKAIYHLPKFGGNGTIAIIGAYDDKTIETDLGVFDKQFGLATCTTANGCFEKHLMVVGTKTDSGWAMETSLDVEWAHAIAPDAKILLVESSSAAGTNLIKAVDYARSRSDVIAISMSWGGPEFSGELSLDSHFVSNHAVFFASSGDNGAGVSWPAVSPNVVAVGGSSLNLATGKETAWTGSGGGVSAYEAQPVFQTDYNIPKAKGMRAVPDVAFNADPASGFSIYKAGKWYVVGGTSAGAPQWAAIQSLGKSANLVNIYNDKASINNGKYLRDITSGSNGNCTYYCDARKHYDYVTGLGSPLTYKF